MSLMTNSLLNNGGENMAKTNYSLKTGAVKSLKYTLITYLVPALLFLLNGYTEWLPKEQATAVAPFLAFASYLIHNYFKIKKA